MRLGANRIRAAVLLGRTMGFMTGPTPDRTLTDGLGAFEQGLAETVSHRTVRVAARLVGKTATAFSTATGGLGSDR